jgi:hypothetical protein
MNNLTRTTVITGLVLMALSEPLYAGPKDAVVEFVKRLSPTTTTIVTKKVSQGILKTLTAAATSLIVAQGLVELVEASVSPEIAQAKASGESSYQTRICNTPNGKAAVPEYYKSCPDGSKPELGPKLELKNL